jgi:hypothetical protein
MQYSWSDTDKENRSTLEETFRKATFSTTHTRRTGLELKARLCFEQPKNKRVTQGIVEG